MNTTTQSKNHRIAPDYSQDPDRPKCLKCGRRIAPKADKTGRGSGWYHASTW